MALALALSGCDTVGRQAEEKAGAVHAPNAGTTAPNNPAASRVTNPPSTTTTTAPVEVTFTPPPGAAGVRPDTPISVAVSGGQLTSMVVNSSTGPVEGTFDGGSFAPLHALGFGETYTATVTVTPVGGGKSLTRTSDFSTRPAPPTGASIDVVPAEGATVGVGMPIMVSFAAPVPREARAAVASWFTVSSTPAAEGAWRWVSDSEMHWRPRYYWPAQADVTIAADLAGRAIGDEWFTGPVIQHFKIGEGHRITIDAATHQMVAYVNDQAVRTMPISTGRDAYPTASGTDLIMEKHDIFEMDSTSAGITGADAYNVTVRYAQRLTNSGTFIHAAPWNGQLGSANISHGCVNASTADAAWMMDFTLMGDPVEISNTPEQVQPYNGWGDWNIHFDQWPNSG